ncbi:hypothetical protein HMPREF1002_04903 [Porphyromonas sp. 31_2]|nr:hypothetical protein HMPREF1002_04903 [Porphyromonas sp. 31_2]
MFAGGLCCFSSLFGDNFVFFEMLRILFFGQFSGSCFGKHIKSKLRIGHIVSQALFFQSFELFIFFGSFTSPRLIDDICKGSEVNTLL